LGARVGDHFIDPTEEDIEAARQIIESLPSLPSNDRFSIIYHPDGVHVLEIAVVPRLVLPNDHVTFANIVEDALAWILSQGHEPCRAPLAAVVTITNIPFLEGSPPPGYQAYEPCKEPTQYQQQLVTNIYEALPTPLPDTGHWRITWTGNPAVGMFQIWVIDAPDGTEFQRRFEEAQEWFRQQSHEPCAYPLAGLIGYTGTNFSAELVLV
jgi:hypothetical protein